MESDLNIIIHCFLDNFKFNFFAVCVSASTKNEVQITPNPSKSFINLKSNSNLNGLLTISNIWGQKVSEQYLNGNQTSINVSALPAGMYVVMFEACM